MSNAVARQRISAAPGGPTLAMQLTGPAAWAAPGGSNMASLVTTAGDLRLTTAGGAFVTVKGTSGNVGIGGVAAPGAALDVSGGVRVTGLFTACNVNVLGALAVMGGIETVTAYETHSSNVIITNYGTGPALVVSQTEGGLLGAQPVAAFYAGGVGGAPALLIDSSGNVGVGKGGVTPGCAVDVSGALRTSTATIANYGIGPALTVSQLTSQQPVAAFYASNVVALAISSNGCLSVGTASVPSGSLTQTAATGGDSVVVSNGYKIHTFTTTGMSSFVVTSAGYVDVLVVAGGGGGNNDRAGGGGAGGLIYTTSYPVVAGTYSVMVGAGGNGGTASAVPTQGGSSTFGYLVAIGGGVGAGVNSGVVISVGGLGGSGGGSGYTSAGSTPGPCVAGQGYPGGTVYWSAPTYNSGGGGGAGGAGGNASSASGGNGGVGLSIAISGTPTYYAGGGGGSQSFGGGSLGTSSGSGGLGGGGAAGATSGAVGTAGTANTGGGGGGGANTPAAAGGAGGSGIVIVRYVVNAGPATAGDALFAGSIQASNVVLAGSVQAQNISATGVLATVGWLRLPRRDYVRSGSKQGTAGSPSICYDTLMTNNLQGVISYTSDLVYGDWFLVLTGGLFSITASFGSNSAQGTGFIDKNQSWNASYLSNTNTLVMTSRYGNYETSVAWTGYLVTGDVVRVKYGGTVMSYAQASICINCHHFI